MRDRLVSRLSVIALFLVAAGTTGCGESPKPGGASSPAPAPVELLNVSHDPTRELYKDINAAFVKRYESEHGRSMRVRQSHGASGSQARAIIDGLEADVATLSIWSDTDGLRKPGLIPEGWDERLPHRSLPYTSTVVFVVRKSNPKNLRDWSDLVEGDVAIITPSPKTSGNGKLSFLAAWGHVLRKGGTDDDARRFVTEVYRRTPVLDTGARGATVTFSKRGIGDVHLAVESEARLEVEESAGELELVYPPTSLVHEPHVTVVDAHADRKGTRAAAEEYLRFLYTEEGQAILARHYFRPSDPKVFEQHRERFPPIELYSVTDIVAGWSEAQSRFFADGAEFDRIFEASTSGRNGK